MKQHIFSGCENDRAWSLVINQKEVIIVKTLKLLPIFMATLLLFTGGCVSKKVDTSGFLYDYSMLDKGPEGGVDLVFIKEDINYNKYKKIMLDSVVIFFKETADYKRVEPHEFKEIADRFNKAMYDALAGSYTFVDEPGDDVLRIRPAITDLESSNPALNTISTVIPVGLVISAVSKVTTGTHTNVGTATAEFDFIDSMTNERVAAFVDYRAGERTEFVSGMTKWGHAEEAFKDWAERIRKKLVELQGRQ
jgi:hypothetical protein